MGESFDDRMEGPDKGLLLAWLRGIEKGKESDALKSAALAGELPILPWRGGLERPLKIKEKLGSMYYLAMWLGVRGDDLDIDTDRDVVLVCSKFGVRVRFTWRLVEEMRQSGEEEESLV